MFYPDANDPNGQRSLPYQPYVTHAKSTMSQQNNVVSPYTAQLAASSHITHARSAQARPVGPRKSKVETLAFVYECKKWLVAGSVIAFGLLGGLVAGHAIGTTSNQVIPASNAPSTSPSSGGGFFQQQPGQQQQQGGGSGFGNGNPSQPPVSGSHSS